MTPKLTGVDHLHVNVGSWRRLLKEKARFRGLFHYKLRRRYSSSGVADNPG
jgi:hypothetical protein